MKYRSIHPNSLPALKALFVGVLPGFVGELDCLEYLRSRRESEHPLPEPRHRLGLFSLRRLRVAATRQLLSHMLNNKICKGFSTSILEAAWLSASK
jgi:hypothetical protein